MTFGLYIDRFRLRASLVYVGIDSPVHLLFLGAVALIVLGPKRLPEVARALGKGMREFRESINLDEHDEDK
jgi:sec-independent protein translocase protein TatA